VAGKTVHVVSVATMRGRRKKKARWIEPILDWAGLAPGLQWWAGIGLRHGLHNQLRSGKPLLLSFPFFSVLYFVFFFFHFESSLVF
jgi:hypothetical protein